MARKKRLKLEFEFVLLLLFICSMKKNALDLLQVQIRSFFIRTSNFGAEAERSYFFHDLRLKMFLRRS